MFDFVDVQNAFLMRQYLIGLSIPCEVREMSPRLVKCYGAEWEHIQIHLCGNEVSILS